MTKLQKQARSLRHRLTRTLAALERINLDLHKLKPTGDAFSEVTRTIAYLDGGRAVLQRGESRLQFLGNEELGM